MDNMGEENRIKSTKTDASEARLKYAKANRRKSKWKESQYVDSMWFVNLKNFSKEKERVNPFESNFKQ